MNPNPSGALWTPAETAIASDRCQALDALGVIHAFAARQPGIDARVDRQTAMEQLAPSHRELLQHVGLGGRALRTAEQVHGARVESVDAQSADVQPGADGLVTCDPSVCLGIYVADCCAVFLVDPVRRVIGLVHSGAKGTRLGIVPEAVRAMTERHGSIANNVTAVLSPCIRPPHYEVDFASDIRSQCEAMGLGAVVDPGVCTGGALGRYYSYRREEGKTGRMLAVLALD